MKCDKTVYHTYKLLSNCFYVLPCPLHFYTFIFSLALALHLYINKTIAQTPPAVVTRANTGNIFILPDGQK
jgi:hypothetical protein